MESAARAGPGTRTQIARSLRARERGKVTSAAIPMVQVIVGAPDHCVSSCLTPLPLVISLADLTVSPSPRAAPVTCQCCSQGVIRSTSSVLILSSPAQILVACAADCLAPRIERSRLSTSHCAAELHCCCAVRAFPSRYYCAFLVVLRLSCRNAELPLTAAEITVVIAVCQACDTHAAEPVISCC
jgi:hypothetical protein